MAYFPHSSPGFAVFPANRTRTWGKKYPMFLGTRPPPPRDHGIERKRQEYYPFRSLQAATGDYDRGRTLILRLIKEMLLRRYEMWFSKPPTFFPPLLGRCAPEVPRRPLTSGTRGAAEHRVSAEPSLAARPPRGAGATRSEVSARPKFFAKGGSKPCRTLQAFLPKSEAVR